MPKFSESHFIFLLASSSVSNDQFILFIILFVYYLCKVNKKKQKKLLSGCLPIMFTCIRQITEYKLQHHYHHIVILFAKKTRKIENKPINKTFRQECKTLFDRIIPFFILFFKNTSRLAKAGTHFKIKLHKKQTLSAKRDRRKCMLIYGPIKIINK